MPGAKSGSNRAPMPADQINRLRRAAKERYRHDYPGKSDEIYQYELYSLHLAYCPCGNSYRKSAMRAVCDEMEEWFQAEARDRVVQEENRMINAYLPIEAYYPSHDSTSEYHERERLWRECRARASATQKDLPPPYNSTGKRKS